jgi:hypothetical protein
MTESAWLAVNRLTLSGRILAYREVIGLLANLEGVVVYAKRLLVLLCLPLTVTFVVILKSVMAVAKVAGIWFLLDYSESLSRFLEILTA